MSDMSFKYGAPMPRPESLSEAVFGPGGWPGPKGPSRSTSKDHPSLEPPHDISKQDPFKAYQRGVAEGIVEGRKQIYAWVLEGLRTLMPLLKIEFPAKTLLHGFMYQLDRFSKTGRCPSNEDE